MKLLAEQYGIEEEDFLSAELEVVPAGKAREAGLDRSMVLGYGQDDRVCAFTSLAAMLEIGQTERTACCILVDKEEIGSVGATGMQSRFFENTVAEVLNLVGEYSELNVRRCLAASDMLSSDVSAAFDPSYASAFEKKNAAFFGRGMVFNKFTGARGKSGSNDANAEYVAHIRAIMEESGVAFQTAELGKIDVGGGGTIAYILALYGMNVIDCGVAVLSMHAPWEATSKADIYETKCGYVAFFGESVPVMEMEGLKTSDYYFDLPKELIAQDPLEDRSASRLLVMDRQTGATSHHIFKEICSFLKPGDCLVLNNTKVIPARLLGAKEDTGAAVEILLLKRMENDVWETLVKPGKKLRPGAKVVFGDGRLRAEILDVEEDGNRLVKFFL